MTAPTDKESLTRKRRFGEEKMVSILRDGDRAPLGKCVPRRRAQRPAGEPEPQDSHVAHVLIGSALRNSGWPALADASDSMLESEVVARSNLHVLGLDHSDRAWALQLRPWVERS
ncbi:MAG: hypothetical protein HIU89_02640 [Proteobacteria bacterium]|nr:hypothetical protein [Pseudomonadota bacterium]